MLGSGNVYKYLDMIQGKFWSLKKCLTYNRPVIVVTGTRSIGKSTAVACFCLLDFIINKHKFMYVRRRQGVTRKTCKSFFANAVQIINNKTPFNILGFKFYNGKYFIAMDKIPAEREGDEDELNWIECGMAAPLSQEEELKSGVYSDYFTIIYDEFISKDRNAYLGTKENPEFEWESLVSLYQTVDRGIEHPFRNEVRLILLGNKATVYNPVMLTLGIADYVVEGAKFTAPKSAIWVWEDVDRVEAIDEVEQSFAYQMSTESVRRYAYENKGNDRSDFIKKPDIATYMVTVKLKGIEYGIYRDVDFNFYIDKPKEGYAIISLDVDSHNGSDVYMIKRWHESPTLEAVSAAYQRGCVFFGNGKIQNAFLKYLEFTK